MAALNFYSNMEELQTERLRLRILTPETMDFVHQNLSQTDLMAFFGLQSLEELEKEKQRYEGGYSTFNKKFMLFQLIDKISGQIIGWCNFHTWYIDHRRAEIGYHLVDDSFKGKGYMSEAILPIIEYGFNVMNLNRIEAFVGPENQASLRLMKKLNFTKEGHLKEHFFKNGRLEDSLVFALFRSKS